MARGCKNDLRKKVDLEKGNFRRSKGRLEVQMNKERSKTFQFRSKTFEIKCSPNQHVKMLSLAAL